MATKDTGGQKRYYLHGCMGARVANTAEAYVVETVRPLREHMPFIVYPDGVHCISFASDKEYLIKDGCCSCEDFKYTAGPSDIRCKHLCAMEMAQAAGEVN